MIKSIIVNAGRGSNSDKQSFDITPLTIFVGPNNSGKSKILNEISNFCSSGSIDSSNVLIDSIFFEKPSNPQHTLKKITLTNNPDEHVHPGVIVVGNRGIRNHVTLSNLIPVLENPHSNLGWYCSWVVQGFILKLDSATRTRLITDQDFRDLQHDPITSFQVLMRDSKKRDQIRKILYEAFGLYLVLDPTSGNKIRLRFSKNSPKNESEELGWTTKSVQFHKRANSIQNFSDGVKAFTGMITEIIAGDPKILLIDEPEAFLHPSLAYTLGKEIAKASVGSEKRIFVSTHSSNFLMGCIQSGVPINIIRLTYKNEIATARALQREDVMKLIKTPLLRSIGILEGIFYEYVIATEGDVDKAFYQEVNDRLLQFSSTEGIPNCLFLNTYGKDTISDVITPLRELGIPAAAIVDIDIIKEGGPKFKKFMKSGFISDIAHEGLTRIRASINEKFEQLGKDMKTEGGIKLLTNADQDVANSLFDQLGEYGLFIVRHGEVEAWLKSLGIDGKKGWLERIFVKMGNTPQSKDYLKPNNSDVWKFIADSKKWFSNPARKGIPT